VIEAQPLPAALAAAVRRGPRALQAEIAAAGGTPLRNEDTVTLFHIGVADAVTVRHWLDVFEGIPPFTSIGGDEMWMTSFDLEPDARVEYKIAVHRHGRQRLRLDALNPHRAANPWGANSELRGAAYQPPPWTVRRPGMARGTVTRHDFESAVFDEERSFHMYTPFKGQPDTVIVVHDGDDYLQYAGLAKVLDNLIHDGEIPPVAALLIDSGDRFGEYRGAARHATHLIEEVLPAARAFTGATSFIAMGASLGGVASLHAAWSHPGTFAGLVLQAPSLVSALGPFGRGAVFEPVVRFMRRFQAAPGALPARVHISCGRYDGLINEARRSCDFLQHAGVNVAIAEVAAGHDWSAWRDTLRPALRHVLGQKED